MKSLCSVMLAMVLAFNCCLSADEVDAIQVAGDDVELEIPDELQDAAFDQYVDMALLSEAWNRLDAAAIADAGLQLAEGERVLFRSHRAVTADQVLAAAARVAGEKRDSATLGRLVKAAKSLGKNDLATMASAAQKLASQARSATPSPTVSLDELSPVDFSFYKASVEGIERARIHGDRNDLDEFTSDLAEDESLPKEIKQHLMRLTDSARSAMDSASKEQSETLDKLLNPSRTTGTWRVYNSQISNPYGNGDDGVKVRVNYGTPRRIKVFGHYNFSTSLGKRKVQVLRSDGTWHGPSLYPGKSSVLTVGGVYYVIATN